MSVISTEVVQEMDLIPVDAVKVRSLTGERESPVYLVNVTLHGASGLPDIKIEGVRVAAGDLEVASVLIGMDIIGLGDFAISHENDEVLMSYRYPPLRTIDFARDAAQTLGWRTWRFGRKRD